MPSSEVAPKAAEAGDAAAKFRLLQMDREGIGVPKNKDEATVDKCDGESGEFICKPVSGGGQEGQCDSSIRSRNDISRRPGCIEERCRSVEMVSQGRKKGDKVAQLRLLEMYSKGIGVPKK